VLSLSCVSTSAQAAKKITWPYGTYKCKLSGATFYLDWTRNSGKDSIKIYTKKSSKYFVKGTWVEEKLKYLGNNKYKTTYYQYHGLTLKVSKKKVVVREKSGDYYVRNVRFNGTFKKIKTF
jgi:hypothetical protein